MYLPPQFVAKERSHAITLMREHPLASLISTDPQGLPFVTHLPLHLQERGDDLVLLGHCARGNPHWRYLQQQGRAVVTFLGPHAYMSPGVYPDLARVPTWNYLAVHGTVQVSMVDEPQAKDHLLKQLIADHEPSYAAQWRGLDDAFAQKMLAGIVAFELQLTTLQCKLKLNQHRPESHQALRQACAAGDAGAQALGVWMDRLGLSGQDPSQSGD